MTEFNDLRGRAVREVHHTDAVVITGEEYMRKSMAADDAEVLGDDADRNSRQGAWRLAQERAVRCIDLQGHCDRMRAAIGSALGYISVDAEEGDEQAMAIVMQLRAALDD